MAVVAITSSNYVKPTAAGADVPDGHNMHSNADGFTFENTGREILYITTTAAVNDRRMDIVTTATVGGYAVEDDRLSVQSGSLKQVVGPFPVAIFGNTVTLKPTTEADSEGNGITVRILQI